ncbi:alpha-amylase family protein [Pseudochryseolinea flava]|uniref:Trehalose synthase n=1 Tax=Pseudochryseolinea flava TaxID=2059302 RepID=A0A364Y777_9BACT|nr:alpha-amylase family protein [Pseudochryseolinea flava]RAW02921.1 trehalose synthase [Pseudochryseolinea flava]
MMTRWFKNAIVYSLDVETYLDSNGDGVGDFQGLISKLDYLSGLGITCIWLLPFFPSPNRDNGYDVKDYYSVDSRLGDLGDFVQFMSKCHDLGIRVIIDLVINHTSIEHPWFLDARKSKDSPYRSFYIWSDRPLPFKKKEIVFPGEEDQVWTYDDAAQQYYFHRFYAEQPDLNIACEQLRKEILRIVEFWLYLRVDGFRIDAAERVIELDGASGNQRKMLDDFFETLRSFVASKNPDAVLLAEANVAPKDIGLYLRRNQRMHMLFNFYINQHIFLSLAKGDAKSLRAAFEKLPLCDDQQQWLNFLRHHDELTLTLLSDEQRALVFSQYAPQKTMRIYNRGIRRRLAPMVANDPRLLHLCYSILFALPGAVLLRYGDEIGMGDNLNLDGRVSVRTPMQWSSSHNAGFSTANARKIVHPIIKEGEYSFTRINVLAQQRDPNALLNFIERMITTRKQTPEIGIGKYSFSKNTPSGILAHTCEHDNVKMFFCHNFKDEVTTLALSDFIPEHSAVFEILCDGESAVHDGLIILDGFGFIWLRVENKI